MSQISVCNSIVIILLATWLVDEISTSPPPAAAAVNDSSSNIILDYADYPSDTHSGADNLQWVADDSVSSRASRNDDDKRIGGGDRTATGGGDGDIKRTQFHSQQAHDDDDFSMKFDAFDDMDDLDVEYALDEIFGYLYDQEPELMVDSSNTNKSGGNNGNFKQVK